MAHWHIDCRLESELPEDNLVGTRFLINALSGALALAGLLFAGLLGYLDLSTRHQIHDWEQRIGDNRAEVRDVQRMQREYALESAKIDEAYKLVRPIMSVSGFIANLGRSRPPQLVLDAIEWNEATVIVHGNIREKSERASQLLSAYVKGLGKEETVSRRFREVRLTGFDRGTNEDVINFEIAFFLKDVKGGRP